MIHTLVPYYLLLRLIDHNDQIKQHVIARLQLRQMHTSPFGQDSSFPNRCSSQLWHLFLHVFFFFFNPFYLFLSFTPLLAVFSLFPCLSNGSLCLTRYVLQPKVAWISLHLHVSLIVEQCCCPQRYSSVCVCVCEPWVTDPWLNLCYQLKATRMSLTGEMLRFPTVMSWNMGKILEEIKRQCCTISITSLRAYKWHLMVWFLQILPMCHDLDIVLLL